MLYRLPYTQNRNNKLNSKKYSRKYLKFCKKYNISKELVEKYGWSLGDDL